MNKHALAVLLIISLGLGLSLSGCASKKPLYGNAADTETPKKTEADPKRAAEINAQLGLGYLQQGDRFAAADKLQRALQDDPNSALVQHGNAILQDAMGQSGPAQEHFRRAIELAFKDDAFGHLADQNVELVCRFLRRARRTIEHLRRMGMAGILQKAADTLHAFRQRVKF